MAALASFTLTPGADTFVGGAGDDIVYGTASTLNAGDSLTGGSGNNLLELIGSGSFDISQLARFTGFQRIQLNNATNSFASLILNNQPVEVDATGYLSISVGSASNWNGSDIIKGDTSQGWTQLSFSNPFSYPTPVTYDLTSSTLSHISSIYGGAYTTLLINNSVTAGVQSFYGYNDQLVTSDATLDLSQTRVGGFTVVSTNAQGTTFTVGDLGTAFQIAGGAGHDTLIAQGFTLTPDQRTTIFATSSIETIVDPSGTYTATPPATVIEAYGSTSLVQVGTNYFLYPVGGSSGPILKYMDGTTPVVAGQTGNWVPIGAEQTATGYQVAWKLAGADQYTVWNTDGSGSNLSSPIGIVSGSSAALEALEPSFNQDLNGDGVIGTATPPPPGVFTLTSGADTFVGGAGDSIVYGTAATLNAGDSLTGGSGTNVLELIGSGNLDINQLAKFTGFQRVQINNATNSFAYLLLNGQPVEVDVTGYLSISVVSASYWNGSDIINGDTSQGWSSTQLSFSNSFSYGTPLTYDLTSSTLSHLGSITGGGYTTLLINNSVTAGIQYFNAWGSDNQLVTSEATLDFSQTKVSGFSVVSTNAQGTTFTVGDLGTAFQIAGGTATTP